MASSTRVWKIATVALLGLAVVVVVVSKPRPGASPAQAERQALPRLVDLGADRCIPCKAMAPILVELRAEYAGRMQVDFIDVWKDPGAGDPYQIYAIPTQIFFGADGKELARHEGFISKADILATWKRVGVDFPSSGTPVPKG